MRFAGESDVIIECDDFSAYENWYKNTSEDFAVVGNATNRLIEMCSAPTEALVRFDDAITVTRMLWSLRWQRKNKSLVVEGLTLFVTVERGYVLETIQI